MQTDGTGMIIAVGGTQNLPNPNHSTPNVDFPFGYSSTYDGSIHFAGYERFKTTFDTQTLQHFTSLGVPLGKGFGTSSKFQGDRGDAGNPRFDASPSGSFRRARNARSPCARETGQG